MSSGKSGQGLNRRQAIGLAGAMAAMMTLEAGQPTADIISARLQKAREDAMSGPGGISIEDRWAIRALLHEYYWLADRGPMERIPDLYTEDGHLIGVGRFINGRKALVEEVRVQTNGDVTRHVSSNLRLCRLEDGSVQATELLRVYRRRPGGKDNMLPSVVADVYWIFKRSGAARWKVYLRYVEAAFRNASA